MGEMLQIPELPKIDLLDFIGKELVHKYKEVPTKAPLIEFIGDAKFRVSLAQEGENIITYHQLMDALNRGKDDGNQYWTF